MDDAKPLRGQHYIFAPLRETKWPDLSALPRRNVGKRPIADIRELSNTILMAELLFEIWSDEDEGSIEMGPVSAQSDQLRKTVSPNSNRVYSFFATSDFEAYQLNYDYHGWGKWRVPVGLSERFFTDAEADDQHAYLIIRSGS